MYQPCRAIICRGLALRYFILLSIFMIPMLALADSLTYQPSYISYDRKLYRHWIDEDSDCQDTRQEVLIAESLEPVELDGRGCRVLKGLWRCPYTGREFTDPSALDIDHLIPLKEAHESGASNWSAAQRQVFANDLSNPHSLVAVWRGANRSKGSRDPASWLPPLRSAQCGYIKQWVMLKWYWGLSYDLVESALVLDMMGLCLDLPE